MFVVYRKKLSKSQFVWRGIFGQYVSKELKSLWTVEVAEIAGEALERELQLLPTDPAPSVLTTVTDW
jgi:hypothetical protein